MVKVVAKKPAMAAVAARPAIVKRPSGIKAVGASVKRPAGRAAANGEGATSSSARCKEGADPLRTCPAQAEAVHCSDVCRSKEEEELPTLAPLTVPVAGVGKLAVVAFYAPGSGLTPWDRRTGGAPFANFWPLAPHTITVAHHGVKGMFHNTEAAYQSLKWWKHDATRRKFEECSARGLAGGEQAFTFKMFCESCGDEALDALKTTDFDGLGKLGGMLLVLRQKWRLPGFRDFLLSTAGWYLVEHCPMRDQDLVWTDNYTGGGENRLGAALMKVREELLLETGAIALGWPQGVDRPVYLGGAAESNWQSTVDVVAQHLAANL